MYYTTKGRGCVDNSVKDAGKLTRSKSLVLILRSKDNGFITFTPLNMLQP